MRSAFFALICLVLVSICQARTITVDDDGPADFNNIQAAINDANNGDTVEIQPGTYTGPGNRDIDFLGKAITVRSTVPSDANIVASTVIDCASGSRGFVFESGEDANSVIDGLTIINASLGIRCSAASPTIRKCTMTNSGRGISCSLDSSPAITGCTIADTSGGAIGVGSGANPTIAECLITNNSGTFGGAISLNQGAATLTNCVLRGNHTERSMYSGGAIRCRNGAILTAVDCTFEDNYGEYGGAISASGESEVTLINCILVGNRAWYHVFPGQHHQGGAVTIKEGMLRLTNCLFVGNAALHEGGALYSWDGCVANVTNSVFAGNSAPRGGAIMTQYYAGESKITIGNCTFSENYAQEGSTLYCGKPSNAPPSLVDIRDSIIWDGGESIVNVGGSTILVSSSVIPGGLPAYGNIDVDPCFADPGYWVRRSDPNIPAEPNGPNPYAFLWVNGDYHLKSQGGRWDANEGRWVKDDVTSACIDAAHPMSAIGAEAFPNGGRLNMGAYGGTAEASKSYFGKSPCETIVAGDINGDCTVDFRDFLFVGLHWMEEHD